MKRAFILAVVSSAVFTGNAAAANVAVVTSPPGILSALTVLFALGCVVFGMQLHGVIRGGLLSRPILFFMGAFFLLAVAKAVELLTQMEVLAAPSWTSPALYVLMAATFLFGLFEAKKVLS